MTRNTAIGHATAIERRMPHLVTSVYPRNLCAEWAIDVRMRGPLPEGEHYFMYRIYEARDAAILLNNG